MNLGKRYEFSEEGRKKVRKRFGKRSKSFSEITEKGRLFSEKGPEKAFDLKRDKNSGTELNSVPNSGPKKSISFFRTFFRILGKSLIALIQTIGFSFITFFRILGLSF